MGWKQNVAGYLTFSKRDRAGVVVLIVLIAVAAALPYFAPSQKEIPIPLDTATRQAVDSLEKSAPATGSPADDYRPYVFEPAENSPNNRNAALFYFDPNTLGDEGWRRLGLREKTIRTINNYRSKGGRFYRPEDLAKIWGLPQGFYEQVKGHIRIAQPESTPRFNNSAAAEIFSKRAPATIDINTADTSAFIALPGIGSKLASRIVNFRNKLGGFTSVAQLGETYGLPDSTFQKIRQRLVVNEPGVQQINVNTATKETLSAHPYINWKQANAIVAYREQHGPFGSVGDLKKIMILDDTTFEKVKAYLAVQ